MSDEQLQSKLRQFKRSAKISAYKSSIPVEQTNFTVTRESETVVITDLQMQFEIKHTLKTHPNTCTIKLTNLSAKSRSELEQKPLKITVEAGYDGVNRLMFTGDARYVMSKLEGTEWITQMEVGDGDRTFVESRVCRSYSVNTSTKTIVTDIANSMGLSLPSNLDGLDTAVLNGTVVGPAREELTRLLAPYGYSWSIQRNQLQILRDDEARPEDPLIISEDTGMIGTPEFGTPPRSGKPPHMKVKVLLYPELLPGGLVNVKSRGINGVFRMEQVEHRGDTHGEPWFTEIELKPL